MLRLRTPFQAPLSGAKCHPPDEQPTFTLAEDVTIGRTWNGWRRDDEVKIVATLVLRHQLAHSLAEHLDAEVSDFAPELQQRVASFREQEYASFSAQMFRVAPNISERAEEHFARELP
jgi:hypothetical protein